MGGLLVRRMGWYEFEERAVKPVLIVGCAYEAVALAVPEEIVKVPSISELIGRLYGTWWGKRVLWFVWGWLTNHFFGRVIERALAEAAA